MNNQAAQTMPELPEPFDTVRVNEFSLQEAPVFSAGQMRAMYQQGYAAALSQTAGVPSWIVNDLGELGVMVNGVAYFLYKGDNIVYEDAKHDDGSPMLYRMVGKREFGEVCRPRHWEKNGWAAAHRYTQELVYTTGLSFGKPEDGNWRPLPTQAAAPAASGGECQSDDDLPGMWERADLIGGMTDAEPQTASVSERARELLAHELEHGGFPEAAHAVRNGYVPQQAPALLAIEQALTQQRVCATCGGRGEIGGHVGQTAETFDYVTEPCPECTTPQPSADAVRELVKRWLTDAPDDAHSTSMWDQGYAHGRNECADELESLLSAASNHQQNAAQGGGAE